LTLPSIVSLNRFSKKRALEEELDQRSAELEVLKQEEKRAQGKLVHIDCILTFFFAEKVASQSESVDHFRTSMEAQLESNREFHARQVKRLREQIEAKNGQVETLRVKNSDAHAESDRIKSEYAILEKNAVEKEGKLKEMETKHEQTNQAKNDLRGLEETGKLF